MLLWLCCQVESKTNHDVKAIEYVIKDRISHNAELAKVRAIQQLDSCCLSDTHAVAYVCMEVFVFATIKRHDATAATQATVHAGAGVHAFCMHV